MNHNYSCNFSRIKLDEDFSANFVRQQILSSFVQLTNKDSRFKIICRAKHHQQREHKIAIVCCSTRLFETSGKNYLFMYDDPQSGFFENEIQIGKLCITFYFQLVLLVLCENKTKLKLPVLL